MTRSNTLDMSNGPLLSKMIRYAIPLAITGILQLLYNAADLVVVGQFAGHSASAAVSSTGSLINLVVGVFMGLSVGVVALISNAFGASDTNRLHRGVHTAMLLSAISGVLVAILGVVLSKPLLVMMGSPDDVLEQSTLYLRIYFLGTPGLMIYNFGAGILRAVGDTKRPLVFLTVSGVINVLLNLLLVVVFRLGVVGVAIATTVSQYLSAAMVVICLMREQSDIHLSLQDLHIHKPSLFHILQIGIPAGIQSSLFSLSNVVIQSSINSFGSVVMAGNGAAASIEGFAYIVSNAFYQTTLTAVGQSMGGKNVPRINKILRYSVILAAASNFGVSALLFLFRIPLLGLYVTETAVIEAGIQRMMFIMPTYFLCGIMEVLTGQLRGIGYSTMPMITSLLGACAFRLVWIAILFPYFPTPSCVYLSYPISWVLTSLAHYISYLVGSPRMFRKLQSNK